MERAVDQVIAIVVLQIMQYQIANYTISAGWLFAYSGDTCSNSSLTYPLKGIDHDPHSQPFALDHIAFQQRCTGFAARHSAH
jgi:hypothetical protein